MYADGHRGGVGQAPPTTGGETWHQLPAWLSAAPGSAASPRPRPQETPEKRRQEQERPRSDAGRPVHATAGRRWPMAWADPPESLGHVYRTQGSVAVGAGTGDQARLWARYDEADRDRAGWGQGPVPGVKEVVSQGLVHPGHSPCGGETVADGPPLPCGRQ